MTPNERDHFTQATSHLIELLARRVSEKLAEELNGHGNAPTSDVSPVGEGAPAREYLTQREAVEWTGLSKSSLRRARINGLPCSKALGQITYKVSDLRDLMSGKHNESGDDE